MLGAEEIGVEDDFFDLGGHSLLLLKAAARARKVFGKELPFEDLLSCRTVASLAELLKWSACGAHEALLGPPVR